MEKIRENWIDHIKVFACILVATGHFFQSMCTSGILNAGPIYEWFIRTIYYFHVQLFFICSGYLYQKESKVCSFSTWRKHALKKLLGLGIPYIVFSLLTWLMKFAFAGEVNTKTNSLWYDLFIHPMSPYWYLFALLFIFLITGTFANKKNCCIGLASAALLKVCSGFLDCYALNIVIGNLIWFVLGMAACVFRIETFVKKNVLLACILIGVFFGLSFLGVKADFVMGLLACSAVMLVFRAKATKRCTLAGYTMPIYLMHTMFAAAARVCLLKLAIVSQPVHIIVGLLASFVGPIFAAEVMKRLKLDVLYRPGKYIKIN